jgi:hypothetical protein
LTQKRITALTSCCADGRYKNEELLLFLLAVLAEDIKIKIGFKFGRYMHWMKVRSTKCWLRMLGSSRLLFVSISSGMNVQNQSFIFVSKSREI